MRALILFFCVMLFGCEKEPLQFFPQDHYYEMSEEAKEDDRNYYWHDDTVVVISPPKNNLDFIRAVDHYIAEHYDLNEIYKYDYFSIGFLKESSDTKRVYQERDEYTKYIEDPNNFGPTPRFNPDDTLLVVRWKKNDTHTLKHYMFFNSYDKKECDSVLIFYLVENEEEEKLKQCQPSSESGD